MSNKSKKNRINIVYSTKQNYEYDYDDEFECETLLPNEQILKIYIDRKQRKGKEVTLITDFIGKNEDLKNLGKILKSKCGVGGSVKNGQIIIQGNHRDKICSILNDLGYNYKKVGN